MQDIYMYVRWIQATLPLAIYRLFVCFGWLVMSRWSERLSKQDQFMLWADQIDPEIMNPMFCKLTCIYTLEFNSRYGWSGGGWFFCIWSNFPCSVSLRSVGVEVRSSEEHSVQVHCGLSSLSTSSHAKKLGWVWPSMKCTNMENSSFKSVDLHTIASKHAPKTHSLESNEFNVIFTCQLNLWHS